MDEISKVLDEAFNGDIQEPEREKVTTDELRACILQSRRVERTSHRNDLFRCFV